MSLVSPKPIIVRVVRTWHVAPDMTFILVEDVEGRVWIVESCPVGTQCWTIAQAAELPQGSRTGQALQEAICEGRALEAANHPSQPTPEDTPDNAPRELLPAVADSLRRSIEGDLQPPRLRSARPLRATHSGKPLVTV